MKFSNLEVSTEYLFERLKRLNEFSHLTGDVCVGILGRNSLIDELVPLVSCRLVVVHQHLAGKLHRYRGEPDGGNVY